MLVLICEEPLGDPIPEDEDGENNFGDVDLGKRPTLIFFFSKKAFGILKFF